MADLSRLLFEADANREHLEKRRRLSDLGLSFWQIDFFMSGTPDARPIHISMSDCEKDSTLQRRII